MTIPFQNYTAPAGLLSAEDVLPHLQLWQSEGQRTALVTLIGVEGGAPRRAGDQMAVAEDGRSAGYLSGGCLEAAVVQEAQAVIAEGHNRLVRYGKGSPYFDIKLPCGSGLDLYFDQFISPALISGMIARRAQRKAFTLTTDVRTGQSAIGDLPARIPLALSRRDGQTFNRVYAPDIKLLLVGNGPALGGLAALAATVGIGITVVSSDDATRAELAASRHRIELAGNMAGIARQLDFATAAVLVLHEHDKEPEFLAQLLRTECFYIGALGNHAVHRARLAALVMQGFEAADLQRIRAPVGTIAGAKSKATLAVGVMAEILEQAKTLNLVS